MTYGAAVVTNKGLTDLYTATVFRKLGKARRTYTNPYSDDFTIPISNFADMVGEVYLFSSALNVNPSEYADLVPGCSIHNDDVYRAGANNLPNNVRVRVLSDTLQGGRQVDVTIYAVNLR